MVSTHVFLWCCFGYFWFCLHVSSVLVLLLAKGAPWNVTPEQVHEVTRNVKALAHGIVVEEKGGASDGFGGGGQGQGQERDARFWEIDLPGFMERCLSSSINDLDALPFINNLFMVSIYYNMPP